MLDILVDFESLMDRATNETQFNYVCLRLLEIMQNDYDVNLQELISKLNK